MWKNLLQVICLFAMMSLALAALAQDTYPSPIPDKTLVDLIRTIIYGLLVRIAIPLGGFAIVVVGIKFVAAAVGGNPGKIATTRMQLGWVVIGVAVVVGSLVIANAVITFIQNLGGGGPPSPATGTTPPPPPPPPPIF